MCVWHSSRLDAHTFFSPIKKHTQPPNAEARAAVQSLHPQTPIGRVRLDAGDVQQVSFCD